MEEIQMLNIAQKNVKLKNRAFGIAVPDQVTDLSEDLLDSFAIAALQGAAEDRAGYRYAGRLEMAVKAWGDVLDNPRQRDTEAHAKKAKHLRTYDPIHRFVNMAQLPDGRTIKLDGHTRALLWLRGEVRGPATVFVDVYLCNDMVAVEELYSKFDSQDAVETGADKIAGAARKHNLSFKSAMLRSGRYGSALKRLFMYRTKAWGQWTGPQFIYDAVGQYREELKLLDSVEPQAKFFPSGVIMATLATFKRRGESIKPFWIAYSSDQGSKVGNEMDAVQALHKAVSEIKGKKITTGGQIQQLGLFGKGIIAAEAFRTGQTYKVGKWGGIKSKHEQTIIDYVRREA